VHETEAAQSGTAAVTAAVTAAGDRQDVGIFALHVTNGIGASFSKNPNNLDNDNDDDYANRPIGSAGYPLGHDLPGSKATRNIDASVTWQATDHLPRHSSTGRQAFGDFRLKP
jgi:hypothetical protein